MNHSWRKVLASFLVLVLIAVLGMSCGDEGDEEGVVTIRIGEITDLTGPGSPAVITLHYCLEDMVRYYNEEGLIPGVKLDIVTWDNKYDPAREIPGYEYVKEHGADIIAVVIPTSGPVLKTFADRDKIPIVSYSTHPDTFEPPGWVFNLSNDAAAHVKTLFQWISDEHWHGEGAFKFGIAAWSEPQIISMRKAAEEWSEDNPDLIDFVASYIVPFGTVTWAHELDALQDCDYICVMGFPMGGFMKAFEERGYSATFIDPSSGAASYRGFLVDMLGYEGILDGTLTSNSAPFWSDDTPIVSLAKELLDRYRPGQKEEVIYAGLAYCGAVHNTIYYFDILKNAIAEVGAENFDGQAFYDAAVKYRIGGPLFEGYYPETWGFTETKRYVVDHALIQEFSAEHQDIVTVSGDVGKDGILDDWLPIVTD